MALPRRTCIFVTVQRSGPSNGLSDLLDWSLERPALRGRRGSHGVLQSYQKVTPPQKANKKKVLAFRAGRSLRENLVSAAICHILKRRPGKESEPMPRDSLCRFLGKMEGRR